MVDVQEMMMFVAMMILMFMIEKMLLKPFSFPSSTYDDVNKIGMETDKNCNKTQKVHFSFSAFRMSTGELVY